MLRLDSQKDKPDRLRLYNAIKESMAEGVKIVIPNELRERAENDKAYLKRVFATNYGVTNPDSPRQVQEVLAELSESYPEIAFHCYDAVTDKWTSKAKALEQLRGLNLKFVDDLILYRNTTAFTKAFDSLEKACDGDGFIHPDISFQVTNRVSYSNPGLMSIPKKLLWQVVQPRKPGWSIWRVDIKNQEPWIFINKLGIKRLQEFLKLSGQLGLYKLIYQDIYGVLPNDIQYKEMKIAWNALTYGSSKKSLIESTFHMGETETCPSDNGRAFYDWYSSFPEIKNYQKEIRSMAYGGKRIIDTVFGTPIQLEHCPPSAASRRLMDYWIQGTGADILAFLVTNFLNYIETYHLQDDLRFYYTRHDEVILEMSPRFLNHAGAGPAADKLRYVFKHTIDDWAPCELEVEKVESITDLAELSSDEEG